MPQLGHWEICRKVVFLLPQVLSNARYQPYLHERDLDIVYLILVPLCKIEVHLRNHDFWHNHHQFYSRRMQHQGVSLQVNSWFPWDHILSDPFTSSHLCCHKCRHRYMSSATEQSNPESMNGGHSCSSKESVQLLFRVIATFTIDRHTG